jgi:hypothetical protein
MTFSTQTWDRESPNTCAISAGSAGWCAGLGFVLINSLTLPTVRFEGRYILRARRTAVSASQLVLVKTGADRKPVARSAPPTYVPISRVWEGSDSELLDAIFGFYPTIPPEPILDATYNSGRIWNGSKRQIVSMDIDPRYKPMIVADNRKMTGVPASAFGTVVYDPPHVGPQGRDKSRKRFDVDFGARVECGKKQDWTLSYLYPPFLKEAKRVLKPNGLLLDPAANLHRSSVERRCVRNTQIPIF